MVTIGWDGSATMTVGGGAGTATLKAYGVRLDLNDGNVGTLTISNNGVVEVGAGNLSAGGTNDIVNLGGGTLRATAASSWSGQMTTTTATTSTFDTGSFAVSSGATISGDGSITKTGSGTLTLSGTTSALNGGITVDAGVLNLTGGGFGTDRLGGNNTVTVNNGGTLRIGAAHALGGDNATMTETVTVNNGGTLDINVASDGQYFKVLNLNGATVSTTTGTGLVRASAGNTWTVGGAAASTISASVQLINAANVVVNDATSSTATDLTISGVITGGSGLNKSGAGTMRLTGTNNYTGALAISAGTVVTGNTAALGAGSVALSGGTLQIGDGTVQTVTLASAKNITATAAATLAFNSATSAITLAGGGKYDFTGQTITLDLNNAFNTVNTYTLISGGTGNVEAAAYSFSNVDTGAFGYSFANGILTVTAIPEPSTYGLLGAGALAGIAMIRRRRKQAA